LAGWLPGGGPGARGFRAAGVRPGSAAVWPTVVGSVASVWPVMWSVAIPAVVRPVSVVLPVVGLAGLEGCGLVQVRWRGRRR
jgi:hypothetical protein